MKNVDWTKKLEETEYKSVGNIDSAMKEIHAWFDNNASTFYEMKTYRHFAKYDLNTEGFRTIFVNLKNLVKKDALKLSNVIEDVTLMNDSTMLHTYQAELKLGLRAQYKGKPNFPSMDVDIWDSVI